MAGGVCSRSQRTALAAVPTQQVAVLWAGCPLQHCTADRLRRGSSSWPLSNSWARLPSSPGPLFLLASWATAFYLEYIICSISVLFCVSVRACECVCASEPRAQKAALDPLDVSLHGALGIEPRFPEWVAPVLSTVELSLQCALPSLHF